MAREKDSPNADTPSQPDTPHTQTGEPTPVALSEGAAVALSSVFARIVKPGREDRHTGKRPRPEASPVVLQKDEEVHATVAEQRAERRRQKESKRARLAFERNAHVVPDAATGAALEKELRAVATQGAVALFNAIANAQRALEATVADAKKKSSAVSKDKFMGLVKAGVIKTAAQKSSIQRKREDEVEDSEEHGDSDDEDVDQEDVSAEDEDEDEDDEDAVKPNASWLKDDFMTKGSSKLKDFDREAEAQSDDEDEDSGEEKDENDSDDAAEEETSGDPESTSD